MTQASTGRAVPGWVKAALVLLLILFLSTQAVVLLGPNGIAATYSAIDGFTKFDDLMLADPLTTAGLIDLLALVLAFAVILFDGLPRTRAFPALLVGFVLVLIVYPGLAALGFLLLYWRRRGQFRPASNMSAQD